MQRQRSYVRTNRGEARIRVRARSYNRHAPGVEHGNRTRLHSYRSRSSPSIKGGSSRSRFNSRGYSSIRGR